MLKHAVLFSPREFRRFALRGVRSEGKAEHPMFEHMVNLLNSLGLNALRTPRGTYRFVVSAFSVTLIEVGWNFGCIGFEVWGNCLASPDKIKMRAKQIKKYYDENHKVIVVVSAMGRQTNELVKLAYQVSETPHRRELDMLLTTGERISMALVSMALNDLGCPAISFTGSQAGIFTEKNHNNAKIKELKPIRVEEELQNNKVVIVAGFQGVNPLTKEVTTLGRGGSDTTAMAFAKHFQGGCYIFKDVPGVCTADPQVYQNAKPIRAMSHDQLIELCRSGSQILHLRAAEMAKDINLNYRIVAADDPTVFTELSNSTNSNFRAIALVKNVTSLRPGFDFIKWVEQEKLSAPQVFTNDQEICFWGDLETITPIHQRLTKQSISFSSGLSFLSLLEDGKEPRRIVCSTQDCDANCENYEEFLKT